MAGTAKFENATVQAIMTHTRPAVRTSEADMEAARKIAMTRVV
jgi:hypothetical protein